MIRVVTSHAANWVRFYDKIKVRAKLKKLTKLTKQSVIKFCRTCHLRKVRNVMNIQCSIRHTLVINLERLTSWCDSEKKSPFGIGY